MRRTKLLDEAGSKAAAADARQQISISELRVEGEIEDMPDGQIYEFIKNPKNRSLTKKLPLSWQRPDDVEYHQYRNPVDLNIHAFWEAPWMLLIGVVVGGIITLIVWLLVYKNVINTGYDGTWWLLLGAFLTFTWAVVITWGNRNRLNEAWSRMHKNTYYAIRNDIEKNSNRYLLDTSRFHGGAYTDPDVSRFTLEEYFDRLKSGGFTDEAENLIEYQKCRNYPERNELMRHVSPWGTVKCYLGEIQLKAQKIAGI